MGELLPRKYERHVSRIGGVSGGLGRGGHTRDFWAKVKIVGETPGGCWEWIGYRDRDGYGKLTTVIDGRVRTVRPHRYLYERERGAIPHGMYLLHWCDNPPCVNPWHMRPGTQRENIRECYARGRHAAMADNRGENSGRATLRDSEVLFIRAQERVYGLIPVLARLFGVKRQVIACVLSRRTWKHIGRGNITNRMTLRQLQSLALSRERADARVAEALAEEAVSRRGENIL